MALGFPVHIGWSFWILPVLVALERPTPNLIIEWVGVVFFSILLHELGHALAYRRYGSPARIELWQFGGLTYGRVPRYRMQDIIISLAGPVPPLLFIGIPAYLLHHAEVFERGTFASQFLLDVWWVNLVWSIVNLLPVLPLDGGRVVDKWFGRKPARIASIITGVLAAIALLTVLKQYGDSTLIFLALLAAGFNAYILYKESSLDLRGAVGYMEAPGGMRMGGSRSTYDEQLADKPTKRGRKAKKRKLQAVPSGPDPKEPEAWTALEKGDVAKADKIVKRLKAGASPVVVGAVLARQGKSAAAVAAYATGILLGHPVPPIGDAIMAEAGLAGQVADWITSTDQADGYATLSRLHIRLQGEGHAAAAAEVGEVRAGLSIGAEAGRVWYETACSWAQAGDHARALKGLRASVELAFASADMVRLEPSFAGLHGDPEFVRILASLG